MIKLIIISHQNLFLNHADLLLFNCLQGGHDFIFIQKGYKTDSGFTPIQLPNQEVPEYPQRHALIRHVQKLYQVRLANSTDAITWVLYNWI